jgi:hypothetical protein
MESYWETGVGFAVNNGEVLAWRSANGEFFCTEFCADDAEEARFQSRRRLDWQVQESLRQTALS